MTFLLRLTLQGTKLWLTLFVYIQKALDQVSSTDQTHLYF